MEQDKQGMTSNVLTMIVEDDVVMAIVERRTSEHHWNEKIPLKEYLAEVRGAEEE